MSFRIDKTNIDYIIPMDSIKYNKDKLQVLKQLHFTNGKVNTYIRNKLKKIFW